MSGTPQLLTLASTCNHRVSQQKAFDSKPLGVGVCYSCGHILWTPAGGGYTYLVDKLDMTPPAAAYLKSVANCSLQTYKHDEKKWYCCSYCKRAAVPVDQKVFGGNVADVRPVEECGHEHSSPPEGPV